MTVAELLTFLIHADQSKSVWIKCETLGANSATHVSKDEDGDIYIASSQ